MGIQVPFTYAKKNGVFVSQSNQDSLLVVHKSKINPSVLHELRRNFNKTMQLQAVDDQQFSRLLAKAYETDTSTAMEAFSDIEENIDLRVDLLESADDAPVIKLINAILTQAIKRSASDIHFEVFETKLLVRFRIDGILHEILEPPHVLAPVLISRLKIMSKLNIAEKRLPQDGRMTLQLGGRAVDIRVSTIPTHYGERIVLRILDKETAPLDLVKLGMPAKILAQMRELIHQTHGIILVTGPTGSGKTTTLYAALTEINSESRNILTIEDPIEYYLPGIGQMQVNPKIGMTFARGLRAILRQDPDIVMVGEIRDLETAEMAIQASLTGHLVLSTLHTNSAIGAIARLRDMGAESFLLSSTIIGVCAQRLVRMLCVHCKTQEKRGCSQCNETGYEGRTGMYELIPIDDTLRNMIHSHASESDLEQYARQHTASIRDHGESLIQENITTREEIMRVS